MTVLLLPRRLVLDHLHLILVLRLCALPFDLHQCALQGFLGLDLAQQVRTLLLCCARKAYRFGPRRVQE
jgi:hypothetical protein